MTKINNKINCFEGIQTTTAIISGYTFPLSKFYINNMTTTSQALTTTSSLISGLSLTLPDEGIYEITVNIIEDLSNISVNSQKNYSFFQLYNNSTPITGTERLGTQISILNSTISNINILNKQFKWIYLNTNSNNNISIYGKKNYNTTGNWNIISNGYGKTNISARIIF